MGTHAASKARRVVSNVGLVLAIEFLCAAQALDLRAPLKPGKGVSVAHARVRAEVLPLTDDRRLSGDIERLAQWLAAGSLDDLV